MGAAKEKTKSRFAPKQGKYDLTVPPVRVFVQARGPAVRVLGQKSLAKLKRKS
jgi:hypothetical protein